MKDNLLITSAFVFAMSTGAVKADDNQKTMFDNISYFGMASVNSNAAHVNYSIESMGTSEGFKEDDMQSFGIGGGVESIHHMQNGYELFARGELSYNDQSFSMSDNNAMMNIDLDIETYLSVSTNIGLRHQDWNGWGAYGILGASWGDATATLSNNFGLSAENNTDIVMGEIGVGVEKEVMDNMTVFAEYRYGRALDDVSHLVGSGMNSARLNAEIETDKINIGARYQF